MKDATTHVSHYPVLTGGGGAPLKEVSVLLRDPVGSATKMNKKKEKVRRFNQQRQAFLLTFFDEDEGNVHREVNGFILEKQWNGNTRDWQVAIYTKESWAKHEKYVEQNDLSWIK